MLGPRKITDLYSGGGDSTKYGFPIGGSRYSTSSYISERRAYRNEPAVYRMSYR